MKERAYFPVMTKKDEELPLFITTIGMHYRERGKILRENGLDTFQILYTESGSGTAYLNGKQVLLTEGDVFCLPPNTRHEYSVTDAPWITSWVTFGGRAAEAVFDVSPCVLNLHKGFDFLRKFGEVINCMERENYMFESCVKLFAFLTETRAFISESPGLAPAQNRGIDKCMKYIAQSYGMDITLSELAEICGVSEEHFCRSFKHYTGMRPFEYIKRFRIQKAKELISTRGEMSLSEISRHCGFASNSYFSLVFKQETGMTAGEYRRYGNR